MEARCDACGFVAKSKGGLASHRRAKHADVQVKRYWSNVDALEQTLAELDRMGRFETIDAARVHMLRGMAAALDLFVDNAALWRQYREALDDLLRDDDSADDDLVKALAEIRGGTTMGNPPTS